MVGGTGKKRHWLQWCPWQGLVLYLAVGVLWVLVGDWVLDGWALERGRAHRYQVWKGWLYVLITGLLAWWLLRRVQQAERVRSATKRRTAAMLRHAPAGLARIDLQGRVLWANDCLLDMLGATPGQAGTLQFADVVRASGAPGAQTDFERLLRGEIDHCVAERLCHPLSGDRVLPVLCTITLVPAEGTEAAHLLCVLQDATALQAARSALARSETRLRLALEGSGSAVWDHDMVRDHTTFSGSMARLLRYTGADLAHDLHWFERLQPQDRARVTTALRRALVAGTPFAENLRLQCFDGEWRWFMARGQRHLDARGRPERFSGVLTDLSGQRRAEERQRLASTVADNTLEGVVVADAQSRILSVNAAFTRMMGYTEEELLGKTPRLFKSGRHDRAFYEALWDSVTHTGHWQGEIWNRRKNGDIFPEHMSLSAVRDDTGSVTHYVCMFTDISESKAQQQRLAFLSRNDPLTGLSNRTWFAQQVDEAVQQAHATGEMLAVLLLNLDRFKDVNDSYGHAVGDQVLWHIAQQVQSALRPGDLLGRLAGDELAVLARHMRSAEGAAAAARQLIAAVGVPWHSPDGFAVVAGVSVGICMYPEHAGSGQALLQGAHAAVYGAKAQGRGSWCFFQEEMTQAARERLGLEARLRHAMEQGCLQLHYQPQVDIGSGRVVGAEALVRWNDAHEGWVSPARFIPVAESSGLIGPLGEWVLGEACRQGQAWRDAGLPAITVAVNVSTRQFHLTDLVGCVQAVLRKTGLPAACLELEITESALADQPEDALQVLQRLGGMGVRLAVDDFGTGYSSFTHLKRFPLDVLKIDQGFIREIPDSADDMAISAAIIAMAHSLGLHVLAEGVETQAQLDFLRARGCDSFQGYLRSRPVPADAFAALLQASAEASGPGESQAPDRAA